MSWDNEYEPSEEASELPIANYQQVLSNLTNPERLSVPDPPCWS